MASDPTSAAQPEPRPWALRGPKGPSVIGDEGYEKERLPSDAKRIGPTTYRDSEGGIWRVIPEGGTERSRRGGEYRRRLRRLYERARHGD